MSKITVIIPVHNTEEYISSCILSLQEQTYKNLEIILINDNSNEDCRMLLEDIAKQDNRIKLYHFHEQQGVGAIRNFGITKATGEFIYFMDSDDYIPEKTLELLVQHIGNHSMIRGRMNTTNFNSSFVLIFDGVYNIKYFEVDKYNLIKTSGVHNFLIRKDFIIKNKLRFSEEVTIYSDIPFMIKALCQVEIVPYLKEAIYFYRRRKDPIKNPSLNQLETQYKIKDFVFIYLELKERYKNNLINTYLDKQLLNFYRKDIVLFFKSCKNIDTYFNDISKAVRKVDQENLKEYDFLFKHEIKVLAKKNKKRFKKANNRLLFLRDLYAGMKSKEKMKLFMYNHFFKKLKTKENWIIFESFQGKGYSDNPKYIYEYMQQSKMNYKFIWSLEETTKIPYNPKQVKRLSLSYYYYLARSKYWVINSRLPNYIDKGTNSIYLQTWHGTPLKRLAGDMDDVHMPGTNAATYKRNFYNETQKWDYLISPNNYSTKIFKSAFWFDKNMLNIGYPRNDLLYNKDNEIDIKNIKTKMNLPTDKKVILYAPTWRDDEFYAKGQYKFNLKLDLEQLQKKLGDEYIVILRMHYFIASKMDISAYKDFAYDMSHYNDIGELYLISDLLITDYSSVFFDYANLKRPILFFTYDIEKYRNTLRGFYIDMEKEVPGPLVKTTDEIINTIKNIDNLNDQYRERYETFYNRFCEWDDGKAAERAVYHLMNKKAHTIRDKKG